MSSEVRSRSSTGVKIDLEVHSPVGEGKMGCLCFRKVAEEVVVYDKNENKLVTSRSRSHSQEQIKTTVEVFDAYIRNKVNNDPVAYTAICKFLDFDANHVTTLKREQVEKLQEILACQPKEPQ